MADFKITNGEQLFYNGNRTDYVQEILAMCEGISSAKEMFRNCRDLTELDVSNLDTSKCTNMQSMFYDCKLLTELDVSNFNTSNVTVMSSMFSSCEKLTELDVSNFNTSNVTSMQSMFQHFKFIKNIDVSNFDTSNVTNMAQMFYGDKVLETIDLSNFDTSKVTNMWGMFYGCNNLTSVDLSSFDTSNVTTIYQMFQDCANLINLDLSNFDFSKVINGKDIANGGNLTNFKSFKNLGKGYTQKTNNYSNYACNFNYTTKLTHESLVDIITNGLYDLNLTYDVANGGTLYTQSLKIGSTNLAKLTAEEIAIATAKGWNVT